MCARIAWLPLFASLSLAWLLGSCASTPTETAITKVKYYHLKDTTPDSLSVDPMIRFEREHLLHGAVTEADQRNRFGHYYALHWSSAQPKTGPITVRLEYRQIGTGEAVSRIEQVVTDVRERNTTLMRVSGEPYLKHGRVVAWRASILKDGRELDVMRSFLWE